MNLKPAPQDLATWLPDVLEVMERNDKLLGYTRRHAQRRQKVRPPTVVPDNELAGLPPIAKAVLIQAAADYHVTVRDIRGRSQLGMITLARQLASYNLIASGYSYPRAGGFLGGRGHDTVYRACRSYEKRTGAKRVGKRCASSTRPR